MDHDYRVIYGLHLAALVDDHKRARILVSPLVSNRTLQEEKAYQFALIAS
jgi:hypothetical protein